MEGPFDSFIFYRDILQSHEEYTVFKSLPRHGSNCINIYSIKTHLPKSSCIFLVLLQLQYSGVTPQSSFRISSPYGALFKKIRKNKSEKHPPTIDRFGAYVGQSLCNRMIVCFHRNVVSVTSEVEH